MTTKLVKCTCNNSFQDEAYGYRNRMANEMKSGQYRCTVCSTVVGSAQSVVQHIKKEEPKKEEPKKEEPKKEVKKVVKKIENKKDLKIKAPEKKEKKASMKGGKR
jgi:hypothetical protein